MRFLLVEFWHSEIYAEPIRRRLLDLGHEVQAFKENSYFDLKAGEGMRPGAVLSHFEHRFRWGPRVARLNFELVAKARAWHPDVVLFFRGDLIWPATVDELRRMGARVGVWHNDDPFSTAYPAYQWRHSLGAIPRFDHIYAYREHNIRDFLEHGAWKVSMLRSFYIREFHFPLNRPVSPKLRSDVAFIGHWENDGRDEQLLPLINDRNIDLRLWGTLWNRSSVLSQILGGRESIRPLYGSNYNAALNGTKIALAFLSKLNRDTYTRRSFEIPATQTLMLSEYSEDLAGLFREGYEAEYFRGPEELHDKVRYYLKHARQRERVALNGFRRLLRDGHEALDRARVIARDFS